MKRELNMNWIDELVDDYYKFLRKNTIISEPKNSEWIEISTPFLDMYNDSIDIYAKKKDNEIILSDDGQTLRNLKLNGAEINRSPQRKAILERILLNYGVVLHKNELTVRATAKDFPQKQHNLISAIAETNDLYVLAKHTVSGIFREDVQNYLDEQKDIIYTPYFNAKGSTGLDFTFDFQIAYRSTEILIKAFNSINKLNLPHFLFTWDDVKQVREKQSQKIVKGLAIINDSKGPVNLDYLEALEKKGASASLWSDRNKPENRAMLHEAA